jgi:RimJ/RimL family protein N-acetyltransferase
MRLPITTERLELRVYRPEDVETIHAMLYGDPTVRRLTGGISTLAQTIEIITHYIRSHERDGYSYWAAVERDTGALVGEVGLKPLDDVGPEIELGYAFGEKYWQRGYATEAARTVIEEAFSQLGCRRIFATAREQNTASRHVLGKLGFTASPRPHDGDSELQYFVLERR